jgi:hypothetical protein
MPACRQCGRENPEGTAFCGYCATPLAGATGDPKSPSSKAGGNPGPSSRGSSAQANPSKPEIRTPTFRTSTPPPPSGDGKGKGGFELIPWSELSAGQKGGRAAAVAVMLFLILFFLRSMLRGLSGGRGTSDNAPSAESANAPITQGDRKDGIESLCKVFQIYGLPKTDHDATEAARNAGELFKLAGNQSAERSEYILTSIVGEFRGGKLGKADCDEAGAPLPTTEESNDNSTPDVER